MNKKLLTGSISLLVMAVTAAWESPAQENPVAPATRKEIRTIVIRDGEKTVVDTVMYGEDVKVFRFSGDEEDLWIDSRLEGDSGKQVRVIVREAGPGQEDVLIYNNGRRDSRRMVTRPLPAGRPLPRAAAASRAFRFRSQSAPNIIDLADPGIISFKKKKMSGGRERITVIRQEVKEENTPGAPEWQIDRHLKPEGDEELERMNAPRVVRELDIRRKELPAPAEVPAPAEKK